VGNEENNELINLKSNKEIQQKLCSTVMLNIWTIYSNMDD
jgi:hypothetical protein